MEKNKVGISFFIPRKIFVRLVLVLWRVFIHAFFVSIISIFSNKLFTTELRGLFTQ